jgi:hypothetical protein
MAVGADSALHVQGYVNSISTIVMMTCVVVILASAVTRWITVLSEEPAV